MKASRAVQRMAATLWQAPVAEGKPSQILLCLGAYLVVWEACALLCHSKSCKSSISSAMYSWRSDGAVGESAEVTVVMPCGLRHRLGTTQQPFTPPVKSSWAMHKRPYICLFSCHERASHCQSTLPVPRFLDLLRQSCGRWCTPICLRMRLAVCPYRWRPTCSLSGSG